MFFSRNELANFDIAADKQWVITNGLGGFASASISGANTSKYHGLLFAALRPPGERTLLLAKLEEEVIIDGRSYLLGSNETGTGIYPRGYCYLQGFELRPYPTYTYSIQDVIIEKVVFMLRSANTTVVRYAVFSGSSRPVTFKVTPLVNCRHYHHTVRKNSWQFTQETTQKSTLIEAYPGAPALRIYSDKAVYNDGPGSWFEGLFYRQEEKRGLDPWEDHFMPGSFQCEISGGDYFGIIASTENEKEVTNPLLEQISAERRLANLVEQAGFQEEFANRLILAADNFIV
ncbi:MAG TPA: glycogen debranching enzyme N-terminal domain-containing protein, partial [Verrucomicrobiae bacterium]|nr:glycogen debranching enzyme N-terminal domain-containing protein [Verrucomicrobiae bacterium]